MPQQFVTAWCCCTGAVRVGRELLPASPLWNDGNGTCLRDPDTTQEPCLNGKTFQILFTAFASEGNCGKSRRLLFWRLHWFLKYQFRADPPKDSDNYFFYCTYLSCLLNSYWNHGCTCKTPPIRQLAQSGLASLRYIIGVYIYFSLRRRWQLKSGMINTRHKHCIMVLLYGVSVDAGDDGRGYVYSNNFICINIKHLGGLRVEKWSASLL